MGDAGARGADLGDRSPVERRDLERRALVDRLRVDGRGEAPGVGDLGLEAAGGDGVAEALGGVAGDDQAVALAGGVAQGVGDGVDTEEPEGAATSRRSRSLSIAQAGFLAMWSCLPPPPCLARIACGPAGRKGCGWGRGPRSGSGGDRAGLADRAAGGERLDRGEDAGGVDAVVAIEVGDACRSGRNARRRAR